VDIFPASLGVFIGRFQPFHLGHQFIIQKALEQVGSLLIVIGSAQDSHRSLKNPFTFEERKILIRDNLKFFLPPKELSRVNIIGVPDFPNDDQAWKNFIYREVRPFLSVQCSPILQDFHSKSSEPSRSSEPMGRILLVGHDKDESTYYLNLFKDFANWDIFLLDKHQDIDGTKIREAYFSLVNGNTFEWINKDNSASKLEGPLGVISTQTSPITQNFLHNFAMTSEWQELLRNQ
jgi:bifunctional NMN adenylyltransferase/nudix hydrolase